MGVGLDGHTGRTAPCFNSTEPLWDAAPTVPKLIPFVFPIKDEKAHDGGVHPVTFNIMDQAPREFGGVARVGGAIVDLSKYSRQSLRDGVLASLPLSGCSSPFGDGSDESGALTVWMALLPPNAQNHQRARTELSFQRAVNVHRDALTRSSVKGQIELSDTASNLSMGRCMVNVVKGKGFQPNVPIIIALLVTPHSKSAMAERPPSNPGERTSRRASPSGDPVWSERFGFDLPPAPVPNLPYGTLCVEAFSLSQGSESGTSSPPPPYPPPVAEHNFLGRATMALEPQFESVDGVDSCLELTLSEGIPPGTPAPTLMIHVRTQYVHTPRPKRSHRPTVGPKDVSDADTASTVTSRAGRGRPHHFSQPELKDDVEDAAYQRILAVAEFHIPMYQRADGLHYVVSGPLQLMDGLCSGRCNAEFGLAWE
eukprot:NODE_1493_length_1396_cov_9.775056_g1240_i0.p1 GENE.NODE_1493_length_1396_cov_9.775056_g1240_i0~~NODE_1493_length_1396_cov_9.775056_g1240_i0.p1  ORF type:complete len:425 (+),score=75.61 NODE_1493_length_1396_cov_9.775056_g1240_i0:32-1306(+)